LPARSFSGKIGNGARRSRRQHGPGRSPGLRSYLDHGAMISRYSPDIAFVGFIVVLMVLKPF
jgi:hypothetical protein